jgi:hypothetical protein
VRCDVGTKESEGNDDTGCLNELRRIVYDENGDADFIRQRNHDEKLYITKATVFNFILAEIVNDYKQHELTQAIGPENEREGSYVCTVCIM